MTAIQSKLPRRLLLIGGGLVLLFLVLHLVGVAMLRYFVEKQLHPALPRGTYVGEVQLNLFTGSLAIEDFQLNHDGLLRMRAKRLVLGVTPWRLVTGEVHIREAALQQAYVRIERLGDGGVDLGLPDFASEPSDATGEDAGELPNISIDGVEIERLIIDYHDGDLQSKLYVGRLAVGGYRLQAEEQQVPVEWDLRWDDRALSGNADVRLSAGNIAVSGELRTDPLDLGLAERLARAPQSVSGELSYDGSFDWSGDTLSMNGDLAIPQLGYALGERQVRLTGVDMPDSQLKVVTVPHLHLTFQPAPGSTAATWETELAEQKVSGTALNLAGRLSYDDDGLINVNDLKLAADRISWQDAGRSLQLDKLAIEGAAQQSLSGDTPFPALNALVSVAAIEFADKNAQLSAKVDGLRLEDFLIGQHDENRRRQLGGRLVLAASEVRQAENTVAWSAFEAGIGGQVGKDVVDIVTNNVLTDLRVASPLLADGPLQLAQARVTQLRVDETVTFEGLELRQLQLPGSPAETSLTIASIDVAASQYAAEQGVDIGQVVIEDLVTAVIRDKSARWNYPMSPDGEGTSDTAATATSAEPAGSSDAMPWRLAGLRVGGESYVTIADRMNPDSLAPRFKIEKLEVGSIGSATPEQTTPFDVVMRPDTYSEFVIKGETRPLLAQPYLKAEGHLHGFAMQSFNGLIANDLGHRFIEGQLDNDFTVHIEDNKLDMGNELALATVQAEELEGKEGPPLATAIALLEDRDGNIKLDVPVSGDLTDPDFRVLGALNPIILKAVAGTAALAIQPMGSVLLVGSLLADQALKVTFEPAKFDAGSTSLNADAGKYLDQLAGKLKEKPKLRLRICGVAVDAERKKDKQGKYLDTEEAMLAVAQQRADAAKARLAEAGAGAKQLRACRPALDTEAGAQPRVDIKF